jgi:ribose transport system substrate-binding protein
MSRETPRRLVLGLYVGVIAGCGGGESGNPNAPPGAVIRPVHLVGFDVNETMVTALSRGAIEGLVVQNPFKMGELGVKTLVSHLEKQAVAPRISTGEALVTPGNMNDPDIKPLVFPPKAKNVAATLPEAKSKKWRIVMIPKDTTNEFWMTIHAGALKAEHDQGNVEVVWQGPEKEDRVQQIQLVQSAVAARADGIVLAPLDAQALVQPVEMAVAKGVPVVVIDSGLESTKPVSTISTNNYNGGVLAARLLGSLLKGEGKVVLLRYAIGSESTEQRERGFTDTLAKECPGISVLSDSEYAGPTPEQAQRVSEVLVTRYRGQFDGVFCPNETSTVGMMRALEAVGLLDRQH